MTDLSKLSTEDLMALRAGNLSAVSTEGLQALRPVSLGKEGTRQAVQDEARSRSRTERVIAGFGTAPRLIAEALSDVGKPQSESLLDRANAVATQINPVSRAMAGISDLLKSGPSTQVEQEALRDTDWYTKGGNIAGNVAAAALLPASSRMATTRPGMIADTALTTGLINSAITPGTTEERALAGGSAALAASVMPVATAVLGMGGPMHRTLAESGKRTAVGEALRTELGDRSDAVAMALRGVSPTGQLLGTKPSASMLTGNPTLEVMEVGSRVKNPDLWRNFDQTNAAQRWSRLQAAAGTPEAVAALRTARNEATAGMRDNAISSASYAVRNSLGDVEAAARPLVQKLENLATGATRPNRDVQTLVKYVQGELGQGVTPSQLYEVRKMLTDGIKAGPTSELSQAAKAARPQRMEIIGLIDSALDDLSRGQWSRYMRAYADASPQINSQEALQNIVSALQRGQPVGAVPTAMGESAAWRTVGNLRDRFGTKQFGSKSVDQFLPEDRQLVEAIATELKRQADSMSAKGILGSPTAQFLTSAGRIDPVARNAIVGGAERMMPGAGILASKAFDRFGRSAEEQLATLLQNPQALAEALDRAKVARALMQGSQRAGAASGTAYAQQ